MVLDLIILGIILLTVILSARRGFMRVLIETVGLIAAVIITFTISTPLADLTYDKIIEPPIVSSVSTVAGDSADTAVKTLWDSVPAFVKNNLTKLNISVESIDKSINDNIGNGVEAAAKAASESVIKPVVTQLLRLVYAVAIMLILFLLVKYLARFINRLFSVSLIGSVNRALGAVIGIPKGIIIAVLFCLVISLVVSFSANGIWIFTREAMEQSWFITHLPFHLLSK